MQGIFEKAKNKKGDNMVTMRGGARKLIVLGLLAGGLCQVMAQTAQEIFTATGIDDGLAAHVGVGNGSLTTALHNQGKIVVSGLAVDAQSWQQAQAAVQSAGLYGLVSIELPLSLKRLPYADNVVNLLVADLDALGANAPSDAEITRVLAPYGKAYVKSESWSVRTKTLPTDMDEWTQFYYDATNNPISRDKLKPATRLRWIGQGTIGGTGGEKGVILAHGRSISEMQYMKNATTRVNAVSVVNATNGLPAWEISDGMHFYPATLGDKLFMQHSSGKYLVYSLKTGALLKDLTSILGAPNDRYGKYNQINHITSYGTTVLIPNHGKLFAINADTYALKWTHVARDSAIVYQVADPATNRVFVVEGPFHQGDARWHGGPMNYVVGLNGETGAELWRNNEWVGKGGGTRPYPCCSQMIFKNNKLIIGGNAAFNIASYMDTFLGLLDAENGKMLWYNHAQGTNWPKWEPALNVDAGSYGGVTYTKTSYWDKAPVAGGEKTLGTQCWFAFDNDRITAATTGGANQWNTADGSFREDKVFNSGSQDNGRCNRPWATENYIITHQTLYLGTDGTRSRNTITRSGCAQGGVPGYGSVFFVSGWCICNNFLYGRIALSSEDLQIPVPEDQRLVKAAQNAATSAVTANLPSNPLLERERIGYYQNKYDQAKTASVTAGDLTITAFPNEQRAEARRGTELVWSFLAGSRISASPLVVGDNVFVASHDGWVYSLKASTGSLNWKFLAAPNEEKVGAFGQIESRWPLNGMALVGNVLYVGAGRHAEMDGGVYLWGLDPSSGAVTWRTRLYKPTVEDQSTQNLNSVRYLSMSSDSSNSLALVLLSFSRGNFRERRLPLVSEGSSLTIDIAGWDGKVINPSTLQVVSINHDPMRNARPGSGVSLFREIAYTSGGILVRAQKPSDFSIRVFDEAGRVVFRKAYDRGQTALIPLVGLASRMHLVSLTSQGQTEVRTVSITH